MEKQPLVSIILPTRNREKYIKRAVRSALNQTYRNIELIIIDDASTDKTPEMISEFSQEDQRIVILANKTNLGLVTALNKGIKMARGKYIARLDDDDFWCDRKKLEKQVDFLEKNLEYVLVGGGVIKIDKERRKVVRYLLPRDDRDIKRVILVDNTFAHPAVVFKKDIWEKVGGYDKKFSGFEDMDLWLKIGKLGKLYNFQEFFVCYLDHEFGASGYSNKDCRRRQVIPNIRLRRKYRNDYPGYGKAFLLCWAIYFYSFLPFKQKLWPIIFKIRTLIFGPPPYKYEYFKKKQKHANRY